ncbi:hypothetical protein Marpi_2130 (plasmid) [Marinitoga piezophila KA3]|uniref:Uncharacterized protein n=1 Tax=Marinitoga piezophila (strain DSM 14283 / JCM 11233 / KA3) TaxID=443254 RepID=H2J8F9_MARPK|nr:hypothetical protein Marpi_2130 [Marinitoga piezophila KA3]
MTIIYYFIIELLLFALKYLKHNHIISFEIIIRILIILYKIYVILYIDFNIIDVISIIQNIYHIQKLIIIQKNKKRK